MVYVQAGHNLRMSCGGGARVGDSSCARTDMDEIKTGTADIRITLLCLDMIRLLESN